MSKELQNILSSLSSTVDQDLLLQYVQNRLSKEQERAVEEAIADDEFAADAFEGLYEMKNSHNFSKISDSLNKSLHHRLKEKRNKKNSSDNAAKPWFLYAIILILLLCVLGYFVVKKLM